jgi:DNA-directed RNA polymerase specialized sigma24 family protein
MTLSELIIPGVRHDETFVLELFEQHRNMIEALAYRYFKYRLDPAFEKDDYRQLAYLAVSKAASKWEFERGHARFASMLYHYIRKEFQAKVNGKHKLVEITNPAGVVVDVLSYVVYLKRRKSLMKQGFSGTPIDRLVSLSDYHQPIDFPEIDLPSLHPQERAGMGI